MMRKWNFITVYTKSLILIATVWICITTQEAEANNIKYPKEIDGVSVFTNMDDIMIACSEAALWEDKYKPLILVPESFYIKNSKKFLDLPADDMCQIKWLDPKTGKMHFEHIEADGANYIKIPFEVGIYNPDASDIVAKETAEAEQAQKEAEQEWYYWWMLDVFNSTILDNVWKNRDKVVEWLKKINSKVRELKLDEHKKLKIVKWLWLVRLAYDNDAEVLKLIMNIARKLKIEKDVKSFKLNP